MYQYRKGLIQVVFISLFLFKATLSFSQSFVRAEYKFSETPEKVSLTEAEQQETAVCLYNGHFNEIAYSNPQETEVAHYITIHRRYFINNSDAISTFNKVYIPKNNVVELIELSGRTISPTGVVKKFDKTSVKEIENDEDGNDYFLFAVEGVEKGGVVEYVYKVKKNFTQATRDFFQSSFRTRLSEFELISPKNLKYNVKGYNGFKEIRDTTHDMKNFITTSEKDLSGLTDEPFALYEPNLARVDFRLEFNTVKGSAPLYSWSYFAQDVVNLITTYEKPENKSVDKLVKELKLDKMSSDDQKIIAIEQFIKSNIGIETKQRVSNNVADILSQKAGSSLGLLRLYSAIFQKCDIAFDIVMTNDRNYVKFDPEFVSYNFLKNEAFYFPSTGKYLPYTKFEYRYGMLPFYWTHNHGVAIKKVKVGDLVTGFAEAVFIKELDATKTKDDIYIKLELDEEISEVKADLLKTSSGYAAIDVFAFYPFIKDEEKKSLKESIVKQLFPDAEFQSTEVLNKDFTCSLYDTTFCLKAKFKTSSLVEKGGAKVLFKIGEAIGPQSQLYKEDKRKLEVENDFNRSYHREIEFKVPAGYKITNPEALAMNVTCNAEGKDLYLFKSSWKLEGQTLKVVVDESYHQINYPKEKYEDYRKVINAAADFNKVVLVLEKI